MSRLTNHHRERMARALTEHKFQDRANALMAESAALFNAVLDERYDAQSLKLMRQLIRRHHDAFAAAESLYLNVRGMSLHVGATAIGVYNVARWVPEVVSRPVLKGDGPELSAALTERLAQFALDLQAFNAELKPAYRKALGTLGQFTTGKKLKADWPEAMPVIGELIPVEDRTLPVVQLDAINDEFGLPPSEMAEAA